MSDPNGPPFFAGSILGLRAWSVRPGLPSSETRLVATAAKPVWEPHGAWTEAVCKPPWADKWRQHAAPRGECTCGLYAHHPEIEAAQRLFAEHAEDWADLGLDERASVAAAGVFGVIEACGRIEVHRDGFRAERARPKALVVVRRWPAMARAGVEELAELYCAELLEAGGPQDVVDYCRERGGVLDTVRLDELLGKEAEPLESPDPAWTPSSAAPTPPSPMPPGFWARLRDKAFDVVLIGLAVCWYGFWAIVVVGIAGGILFGWFDEEPNPPPAKIVALEVDRDRCRMNVTVVARRPLKKMTVRATGRDGEGGGLGHLSKRIGPIAEGRSRMLVAKLPPQFCNSPQSFTFRIRSVEPGRLGTPVSVRSAPSAAGRQEPRRTSD